MDDLVFLGNLFFMSVKVDSNAFHVAKLGAKSKNFQEKGNLQKASCIHYSRTLGEK